MISHSHSSIHTKKFCRRGLKLVLAVWWLTDSCHSFFLWEQSSEVTGGFLNSITIGVVFFSCPLEKTNRNPKKLNHFAQKISYYDNEISDGNFWMKVNTSQSSDFCKNEQFDCIWYMKMSVTIFSKTVERNRHINIINKYCT